MMTVPYATLAAVTTGSRRACRAVDRGRDRGASALEFAIIAAIVVIAMSVIGAVIYNIVSTKSTKLNDCGNQPLGSACAP